MVQDETHEPRGVDDRFTKEQQDAYFDDDCCPYCKSEALLVSAYWEDRDDWHRVRKVFCDDCEEKWVEVRPYDGPRYLLTPERAEEFFAEDEDDDILEDDDDDCDDENVTEETGNKETEQ